MKLLPILIVALIMMNLETRAQVGQRLTPANYEQKAQLETDSMHARLDLSAVQKDSVANINRDYFRELALLQSQNITVAQRTQQYALAEQLWKIKLASNLSTSQYNQHFTMVEQIRIKWQQKLDSLKAARNQQ